MPDERQVLGTQGERAAERFLRARRYVILERNYRCPAGEIDLIALHGKTVVFVEVKTRRQGVFGSPFDAVDRRKRRQIVRAAQHFLARHGLQDRVTRFDVVAVWRDGGETTCEVIENAFEAEPGPRSV